MLCITVLGQNKEVYMKTRYNNGIFETKSYIEPEISSEIMHEIVSDIYTRVRHLEVDSLEWAIKGLSGKEDGKNMIRINLESIEFKPDTHIYDLILDVYVNIIRRQFTILVSVLMKYEVDSNGNPYIVAEVSNPNFFLKNADGTFYIRQTEGKKQFAVQSSVSFGWFFNLFISTSNYSSIAEWRIQTFLENVNAEAKRRSQTQKN